MGYVNSLMKGFGIATIVSLSVKSESMVGLIVLLLLGIIIYSIYDWVYIEDLKEELTLSQKRLKTQEKR